MSYWERIENALKSPDARSMDALVHGWSSEGLSKRQIYEILTEFLEHLRAEGREEDEMVVESTLDALDGYCHPAYHLLPNEKL